MNARPRGAGAAPIHTQLFSCRSWHQNNARFDVPFLLNQALRCEALPPDPHRRSRREWLRRKLGGCDTRPFAPLLARRTLVRSGRWHVIDTPNGGPICALRCCSTKRTTRGDGNGIQAELGADEAIRA